ncbi:MAG: translesion error-prone DNA polymerase V autoproteolytic subunit [Prevotella sp.]|jgi:DNA polymerase V|nr:translesion error-prone DNA polymerase V autoproteolytic subunit [Prevotella sp.]
MARIKYIYSSKKNLELFKVNPQSNIHLPFADEGIQAGFPSPAQDYLEISIDLNRELIRNPSSTFLAHVKGDSMQDAGIEDGDILVIDKSLEAKNGDTVVFFLDGDFTIKTLKVEKDSVYLIPANPEFQPIRVTEENNAMIWGVVTYSIHNHKKIRKRR